MQNYKEKCARLTEKHNNIENKLKNREDKIDIFTKKHKQLNELRFQDLSENLEAINDQNFQRNCKIDEKHLALSLMNQDRKMFMQNYNDRFRSRLNKESKAFKSQDIGGRNYYANLQKSHQQNAAFAPDMVKLTKAQLAKLLKEKKTDD